MTNSDMKCKMHQALPLKLGCHLITADLILWTGSSSPI